MSKIIDKLKGLENEQLREEDLEPIEIIDDDRPKINKNLFKIIVIFFVFLVSVYAGFKLASKYFTVEKKSIITDNNQKTISNNINIPQKDETKKVSSKPVKEPKLVVFSGGKDFEKFLQARFNLDPQNSVIANNLAIFYFEHNDIDNALKYAQKALMLDPDNPYFWNTLGIVLTELKLYDDAEKCFKKAIEKKPDEGVFYYNLANLYERQDKIILAKENYLLYLTKSDKINSKMLEYVREKLRKGV